MFDWEKKIIFAKLRSTALIILSTLAILQDLFDFGVKRAPTFHMLLSEEVLKRPLSCRNISQLDQLCLLMK